MSKTEISQIAEQLDALSVVELDDVTWSVESLAAVLDADYSSQLARLYACEILLRRNEKHFLEFIGPQRVAAIYVAALKDGVTTDLNPWAFLGLAELGPLGLRLVTCGEAAIAELVPLLQIKRPAGLYGGSEESKEGNSDSPRLCDFAAFFIAKIKHLPYRFYRNDATLRDAEINQLKKEL